MTLVTNSEEKSSENLIPLESGRDSRGRFLKGSHWRPHQAFRDKSFLIEEYVNKQRSTGDIAKQFGVTDSSIMLWLKKHKIKTRTASESRAVKHWGPAGSANPMFGKLGSLNPNYKHGNAPERQKVYARWFWKQLVLAVRQRDDNKCKRCCTTDHLVNHHVKDWKKHPESRYDIEYIVTLCQACHKWVHSKRNVHREFLLP